jgi:hypothetical protein
MCTTDIYICMCLDLASHSMHIYIRVATVLYLICTIIFDCGNRESIEISSTLVMIGSHSNQSKVDLFPFILIYDMPGFLSRGQVQIIHMVFAIGAQ